MEWMETCLALALGILAPMVVGLLVILFMGLPIYLIMKLWELAMEFTVGPLVDKLHDIPFLGRFLCVIIGLVLCVPLMAFLFFAVILPNHFVILSWMGAEFEPTETGMWYFDFYRSVFSWLGRWVSPLGNPDGPIANNPYLGMLWALLEAPFLLFSAWFGWLFEIRIFLFMACRCFIG